MLCAAIALYPQGGKAGYSLTAAWGVVLSRLRGCPQERAYSSTAARMGLGCHRTALRWAQPRHVERVESHIHSRPSWLAAAHSLPMVTLGLQWEFQINTIRSCQDVSHDSNLGQNFTDFEQGRRATFT